MKASRLLLLGVLALIAVIAFLVRQRSDETGEDYAAAGIPMLPVVKGTKVAFSSCTLRPR